MPIDNIGQKPHIIADLLRNLNITNTHITLNSLTGIIGQISEEKLDMDDFINHLDQHHDSNGHYQPLDYIRMALVFGGVSLDNKEHPITIMHDLLVARGAKTYKESLAETVLDGNAHHSSTANEVKSQTSTLGI